MKHNSTIWVQSCSAESDAGIWGTYQASARRHARKVVRPGLEVEFHGVSATYPGIDFVDSAISLVTREVVANAIRAEQAGYAAFAFISTNDAGSREVRELTGLPASFISESAAHTAAQLGGKFAFLTHNAGSRKKMEQLTVERYGLGGSLVEGASLALTYNDFAGLYRDPAPHLERVREAARPAIARGAAALVPAGGPFNMFCVDHELREIDGVPVIDILAVVLKDAERQLDLAALGSPQRRDGGLTPEQKDKLRALFLAR